MATEPIRIDIVSDAVCPWCFVGKRHLERALDTLRAEGVEADVRWHPFQLDPSVPPEGVPFRAHLERKFGPAVMAGMTARLGAVGQGAGIAFAFDAIGRYPNTIDAHRVLRWALDAGVAAQNAVAEALFAAYFEGGADLSDPDVLASAGEAGGLDAALVRERLATDEDVAAVRADVAEARDMGITGVPTVIIDRRLALSGAQPPEVFADAIRRAVTPEA